MNTAFRIIFLPLLLFGVPAAHSATTALESLPGLNGDLPADRAMSNAEDAPLNLNARTAEGAPDRAAAIEPTGFQLIDSLEFRFLPGVWLPRVKGNTRLNPGGDRISYEDGLSLDDREATFLPELSVRKDAMWELRFQGYEFSTSGSGTFDDSRSFGQVTLNPGDTFRAELDFTSYMAELRIGTWNLLEAVDAERNVTADGRHKTDLRLWPTFGVRTAHVRQTIERVGGERERARGDWVFPYLGLHMQFDHRPDGAVPLLELMTLEAGVAIGPSINGNGYLWQVHAGLSWHVTDNLGILFGYRLVELERARDGDFKFDGGLQGVFVAGSLRF